MGDDGYSLYYYAGENSIIITLPQTKNTIANTAMPVSDRKVHMTYEEQSMILNLVRMILEQDGDGDG